MLILLFKICKVLLYDFRIELCIKVPVHNNVRRGETKNKNEN